MEKIIFEAEVREAKGKGAARKLRSKGFIPGIIYGPKIDPIFIKLEKKLTEHTIKRLSSHNVMAEMRLKRNGKKEKFTVILKEIQFHPIKDEIIHLDFYKVISDKPVIMEVPIIIKGKSIGEEKGGILEQELREIKIEGLPENMPDAIELDISHLDFGHAILVKDLKIPPKVKVIEDENKVVVTILKPKEMPEEVKVEEVIEEPTVITQEKVEERRREKEEIQKTEPKS